MDSVELLKDLKIANIYNNELFNRDKERSLSFEDSMKDHMYGTARISTQKPHRKNHHHHHHSHHHHHHESRNHGNHQHHQHHHHHHHHSESDKLSQSYSYNQNRNHHDSFTHNGLSLSFNGGIKNANASENLKNQFLSLDGLLLTRPRSHSDSKLLPPRQRKKSENLNDSALSISISSKGSSCSTSPQDIQLSPPLSKFSEKYFGKNFRDELGFDVFDTSDSKEELLDETEKVVDKSETLKIIENLITQIELNKVDVETEIISAFAKISLMIEDRKQALLDCAKEISDQKIKNLLLSKERCNSCRKSLSRQSSLNNIDMNGSMNGGVHSKTVRKTSVDDHDDILQENKILEPWKISDNLNEESISPSEIKDDTLLKDLPNEVFSDILEEGDMVLELKDELCEMLSKIGSIKEILSSPQLSFTKGLNKGYSILDDEVTFEIHTRNKNDEPTFFEKDKIEVSVVGPTGNSIDVEINHVTSSKNKSYTSNRVNTFSQVYSPSFTPDAEGLYLIYVKINHVEIHGSPFQWKVYSRLNLTFQHNNGNNPSIVLDDSLVNGDTKRENPLIKRMKRRMIRQESQENDWMDSDWIFQKGDKSSLLKNSSEEPSYIFVATEVKGECAWKLRVNSACTNIVFSVGVATRSGIPDIDEFFYCKFSMKYLHTNDNNNGKNSNNGFTNGRMNGKTNGRKLSTFTRFSQTYSVLLNSNEGFIRVRFDETEEEKTSPINLKILQKFNLYPFCSMLHNHESCDKQICPRPQITLI